MRKKKKKKESRALKKKTKEWEVVEGGWRKSIRRDIVVGGREKLRGRERREDFKSETEKRNEKIIRSHSKNE